MNYYLKQYLENLESCGCEVKDKKEALEAFKEDIAKYETCLENGHDFGEWQESNYTYKTSYVFDGEIYPTVGTKLCWERTCKNCDCVQKSFEPPQRRGRF